MIRSIDHQKQTRSQGGGIPCRRRYVLVPVDRPQGLSDGGPLGCRSQFDFLPVELAGVRPGPFPEFRLRGGPLPARAKATVLFPSRQMSSRHNSKHCRSLIPVAVWAGAERRNGCSASRSRFNFLNSTDQPRRQALADLSSHLRRLSSSGLDEIEPSERQAEACSRKTRMRFNP